MRITPTIAYSNNIYLKNTNLKSAHKPATVSFKGNSNFNQNATNALVAAGLSGILMPGIGQFKNALSLRNGTIKDIKKGAIYMALFAVAWVVNRTCFEVFDSGGAVIYNNEILGYSTQAAMIALRILSAAEALIKGIE